MAGFKKGHDGAYFNAFDTHNECFKLIEDSIAAVGMNTETKNHLRIGINCDSSAFYLADADKYDWDGGKVQYDVEQMVEIYEKLIQEHPLLTYVEDPFVVNHVSGYKQLKEKLKEGSAHVEISVSAACLDSSMDKIKELTNIAPPESDEEAEKQGDVSALSNTNEEVVSAVSSPSKEAKKEEKKKGKGKKADEPPPEEVKQEDGKPDPLANKFIPSAIRVSSEEARSVYFFRSLLGYSQTMTLDDNMGLVVEDAQ